MRRMSLIVLIAALAGWAPDMFTERNWYESQLLTRTAPTPSAEPTGGFDMTRVIGFVVTVRPGSMTGGICTVSTTATFSGSGTVDLYFRDPVTGWYLGDQTTFLQMNSSVCSGKNTCSKTFDVITPRGRALPAANAITLSAGNCVRIDVLASVSGKSSTH
jgi:hypothetical protein